MLITQKRAIERRLLAGDTSSYPIIARDIGGVSVNSVRDVGRELGIDRGKLMRLRQLRLVVRAQQRLLVFQERQKEQTMSEKAAAPAWYARAEQEIGTHEVSDNRGPAVRRYIGLARAGVEGDPWCAIFVNAMLESAGVPGTRSASSQSFRHDDRFVKLAGPALGAIAVFWRGSKSSGLGHVGFYAGERGDYVWVLGGNESDMVQTEALPKQSNALGLVGYYWPAAVSLPTLGAIVLAGNIPRHIVKVT